MITLEGAIFGTIIVNSNSISFKSCPRKQSYKKYRYGSPIFSQIAKKVNKRWKLTQAKEVLVKRYNLIRQAIEIYFKNNSSVFLSFFSRKNLRKFLHEFHTILLKKKEELKIELVTNPEQYFEAKRFREKWIEGAISNFTYLMLLNKYGGRSFNDLGQYPIFPWIISNYKDPLLNITNPKSYRQLNTPIGAISPLKRDYADNKLAMLLREKEIGMDPYQIGTHCMPGRIVLGYLYRIEPFSSLLLHFEKGRDTPSRMFHVLGRSWLSGTLDFTDNKELVPEFFYLPSAFHNFNQYSYGTKLPDTDTLEYVKNPHVKVRVDQVLLPKWARNGHDFVKTNVLALEGRIASLSLHEWIDLIFGEKQQDHRYYNMYKNLCDEEYIARNVDKITESNIAEIQEFGSNPIKLFRRKHPPKNENGIEIRTQYAIFSPIAKSGQFALLKVKEFNNNDPIVCIKSYLNKVYVVLNSQKIVKSKEGYVNEFHEKAITFENKGIRLHPHNKCFESELNCPIGDLKRAYAFMDHGKTIITCRHYDNSCRMTSFTTDFTSQITFHRSLVNAVFLNVMNHTLFTASTDGVLAKWDSKVTNPVTPQWFVCDLSEPIVTLDSSRELDIVAVGGLYGSVAVRTISTGKFICVTNLTSEIQYQNEYELRFIRISFRGYIVLVVCSKYKNYDTIMVMTINGDLVAKVESDERIYAMVLDESGYYFITGGSGSKLLLYDLISLESKDLLKDLDGELPDIEAILNEFLEESTVITALELTPQEGCQQLLIGTNKGTLYSYRYSPRVISKKISIQ